MKTSSWGLVTRPMSDIETPFSQTYVPSALQRLQKLERGVLAQGMGRSYGDTCLNSGGGLLMTRHLDRCHSFDREHGILRADAGLTLENACSIIIPHGWMIPVTPGTKFVTLGGAVANDVHGKNHHVKGTFGHHVRCLGLRRSDGSQIECGPDQEVDLFRATVGGLGLTGLIEWVEIALEHIDTVDLDVEDISFSSVEDFFDLSEESSGWPHTVAWVDCMAQGKTLGRGIFSRGRPAATRSLQSVTPRLKLTVPFVPPISLINTLSVQLFNEFYYRRILGTVRKQCHFDSFIYPLDAIHHWNRIYGPRGFYQYQCVIPPEHARADIPRLLRCIADSRAGSCLIVLKNFADIPAAGMLSFPRSGTTLALDFPNKGASTLSLFEELDKIVAASGGRLYPAKDARMSKALFHAGYPRLGEFERFRDPGFQSDFWRRMTE